MDPTKGMMEILMDAALKKIMEVLSPTALSNLFTMGAAAVRDDRQRIPDAPGIPSEPIRRLRARLILEEALETVNALGFTVLLAGDIVRMDTVELACGEDEACKDMDEVIDGCCDLNYVLVGTMLVFGVPDQPHFDEVNRANNAKFPRGHAITDGHGKFQKPAGWTPPDHSRVRGKVYNLQGVQTALREQPSLLAVDDPGTPPDLQEGASI